MHRNLPELLRLRMRGLSINYLDGDEGPVAPRDPQAFEALAHSTSCFGFADTDSLTAVFQGETK
jgi:hypothetical protein